MESILLSLFSSYFKKYVNNFRKEQFSLNFLRGQGVIKNLDLNVDAVNELVFHSGAVPGLRFVKIRINSVSLDIPFLSLKTKPIVTKIDEIYIEIGEVVDIEKSEEVKAKPSSSKYGFTDRVLDSITVEINKVFIAFRTLGRLKTNISGDWRPPVLLLEILGNRYYSTNHNGIETELEECFRIRTSKRSILFVYKRLTLRKVAAYLINPEIWDEVSVKLTTGSFHNDYVSEINKEWSKGTREYAAYTIFKNLHLDANICIRKRLDKNITLGLETAYLMENVTIFLNQNALKELIHLLIGISYSISRKDVIESIYGSNPHNETNVLSTSIPQVRIRPRSTSIIDIERRSSITRDTLENEDIIISRIELADEDIGQVTVDDDREVDWQMSSLDTDVDPPHSRIVMAYEIKDCTITLSFDDPDEKISYRNNKSHTELGAIRNLYGRHFRGVTIHILGLCYSTIWPEHASRTEAIQQCVFNSLTITEFVGVKKTCLFRAIAAADQSVDVNILPRGIKEIHHNDPEVATSGFCFAYRRDSDFPPPPLSKHMASRISVMISDIEVISNLDSWFWLLSCIVESWDDRWVNGNWDNIPTEARLEDMLSIGSTEAFISCNHVQILIYPDFIQSSAADNSPARKGSSESLGKSSHVNSKDSSTILPSQIILDIGKSEFQWKPSLELRIIEDLRQTLSSSSSSFPSSKNDISYILANHMKKSKPNLPNGFELLSDRFEARITDIKVNMITSIIPQSENIFARMKIGTPMYRTVVHPFDIIYNISIDPNPFKDPIIPPLETFLSPYTRRYYWPPNSSTIHSSYISISDIRIECSSVDIIRLTHMSQLITNWLSEMSNANIQSANNESYQGTNLLSGLPQTIFVINLSKLHVLLLKDDDSMVLKKDTDSDAPGNQMNIILGIQLFHLNMVFEWFDGISSIKSDSLIFKSTVEGFAILAGNRPIFVLVNEDMHKIIQKLGLSAMNNIWNIASSQSEPVFSVRLVTSASYENENSMTIINESSSSSNSGFVYDSRLIEKLKEIKIVKHLAVNFCDSAKIILSLQNVDSALQSLLSELLGGAGFIFSNTGNWLDSSILGYLLRIYREFMAESINTNDLVTNIPLIHDVYIDEDNKFDPPLHLSLVTKNIDLILLDVHNQSAGGDFFGFGFQFTNTSLHSLLQLPQDISSNGSLLHWKSIQQLYLFSGDLSHGKEVNKLDKRYISNTFPFQYNMFSFGFEPITTQSSLLFDSLLTSTDEESKNIVRRLIQDNVNAFKEGMSLLSSDRKGISYYIQNTWAEINSAAELSALGSKFEDKDDRRQMESLFGLTMHLLNKHDKTFADIRESPRKLGDNINKYESEKMLVQKLRTEIHLNYKKLESFCEEYYKVPSQVLETIESFEESFQLLREGLIKINHLSVLSSNQIPVYCGYVKKSNHYVKFAVASSSSSMGAHTRYWCVFVNQQLHFMSAPYASTIEYSITLDENMIQVIDPDLEMISSSDSNLPLQTPSKSSFIQNTTALSSKPLTSRIWLSHLYDGILVIDCERLDEKCVWKDMLKPWIHLIDSTGHVTKHTRRKSKLSKMIRSSLSPAPSLFMENPLEYDHWPGDDKSQSIMSNLAQEHNKVKRNLIHSIEATMSTITPIKSTTLANTTSKFHSVTKGMLKAINHSRKSVSSTISNIVPTHQTKKSHSQPGTPVKQLLEDDLNISNDVNVIDALHERLSIDIEIDANDDFEARDSISRLDDRFTPIVSQLNVKEYPLPETINRFNTMISELQNGLPKKLLEVNYEAIESIKSTYAISVNETKIMIESMRDSFLAMFLGLSILYTIEDENNKAIQEELSDCKDRINSLVRELHEERAKNHQIMEEWVRARKLHQESESVLQACMLQNMNTVMNMSKQFDDLMEQYNLTRTGGSDVGYFAMSSTTTKPLSPQELVSTLILNLLILFYLVLKLLDSKVICCSSRK